MSKNGKKKVPTPKLRHVSPKYKELELTDRRADKMNSGFTVNREERLNTNKRDSRACSGVGRIPIRLNGATFFNK